MLTCPQDSRACNKAEGVWWSKALYVMVAIKQRVGNVGLDVSLRGILTSTLFSLITSSYITHLLKIVLPSEASNIVN